MSAVADRVELKTLERRLTEANARLRAVEGEKADVEKRLRQAREAVSELQKEKEALKERAAKGFIVSEHAILRYLERVEGIDMDAVREKVLPSGPDGDMVRWGRTGIFPVGKTHRVRVHDGTVVTVLTNDGGGD